MARKEPEPVRITTATRSHSDDIWAREKRYMITMGIRTACFLAAVVCILNHFPTWLAWVFMIGSLILPYIAVVMANAGVSPDPGGPDPFDGRSEVRAITPPSPEEGQEPGSAA
jgi:hypothetical protein